MKKTSGKVLNDVSMLPLRGTVFKARVVVFMVLASLAHAVDGSFVDAVIELNPGAYYEDSVSFYEADSRVLRETAGLEYARDLTAIMPRHRAWAEDEHWDVIILSALDAKESSQMQMEKGIIRNDGKVPHRLSIFSPLPQMRVYPVIPNELNPGSRGSLQIANHSGELFEAAPIAVGVLFPRGALSSGDYMQVIARGSASDTELLLQPHIGVTESGESAEDVTLSIQICCKLLAAFYTLDHLGMLEQSRS